MSDWIFYTLLGIVFVLLVVLLQILDNLGDKYGREK